MKCRRCCTFWNFNLHTPFSFIPFLRRPGSAIHPDQSSSITLLDSKPARASRRVQSQQREKPLTSVPSYLGAKRSGWLAKRGRAPNCNLERRNVENAAIPFPFFPAIDFVDFTLTFCATDVTRRDVTLAPSHPRVCALVAVRLSSAPKHQETAGPYLALIAFQPRRRC